MSIQYKPAPADLAAEYIQLRGLTRENAISQETLGSLGITAKSWACDIEAEGTQGFIAQEREQLVGYCFGDVASGEILVLAVLPNFEGRGVGQTLLSLVVEKLRLQGCTRLVLGCSPDPKVRSFGFYRRLGWCSTGTLDANGDEILELACL